MRPYRRQFAVLLVTATLGFLVGSWNLLRGKGSRPVPSSPICPLTLALILCDSSSGVGVAGSFQRQINQTLVLLKSLALQLQTSSSTCASIYVLTSSHSHFDRIVAQVKDLTFTRDLFHLTYIPVLYPPGMDPAMASWFRPCATLRLFLPQLLPPSVTSVLYVDTDFIFLDNPMKLMTWVRGQGQGFSNKLAAMAPCLFHYGSKANKIPYYGGSGLNAGKAGQSNIPGYYGDLRLFVGLMVMNLARMRASAWSEKVGLIAKLYSTRIHLADQDILNIYFHFFPGDLVELGCAWNWRPFQCRQGSECNDTEIGALHGNALSFTEKGSEPLFQAVYEAFSDLSLGNVGMPEFLEGLEMGLVATEERWRNSYCARYGDFSTRVLESLRNSLILGK